MAVHIKCTMEYGRHAAGAVYQQDHGAASLTDKTLQMDSEREG